MNAAPTTPALANDAQRGSHWQQRMVGRHSWCVLHHADCLDVLPITADAVVTDPPYGIYACGGKWGKKAQLYWDKAAAEISPLLELAPLVAIWGGNYFVLPPSRGWLSWWKPDRVPSAADMELCWTNQDMNARSIKWSIAATNAERVGHPTQKPVRVMAWTLEQLGVPKGATVLDPYMGSGSTAIACIRLGMNFIGIERDAAHYKTACDRIAHELDGALL